MKDYTNFFSYAREDAEFALKLATDLRSAGVKIWLDQLDIVAGQRWDRAVEEALDVAESMILFLSPDSVSSENVMDEVSFAMEQKDRIVPVLIRECKIPLRIARLHYIDFTLDYDVAFERLLHTLGFKEAKPGLDTLSPGESDNTLSSSSPTSSTQPNAISENEAKQNLDESETVTRQQANDASPNQVHAESQETQYDSSLNETIVQSLHVWVEWDDEVREFSGDFTIGRDKNNAIQLNDPQVSRQHAAVTFESGGWMLTDLDSRNGVRLNGKLIKKTELPKESTVQLHMYGTPLSIRVI